MRFKLSAGVQGLTRLAEDVTIEAPQREYYFHRGENGYLDRIDIIAEVDNPAPFYGGGVGYGSGMLSIQQAYDPALRDQLIVEFQQLESLLGYHLHIDRIKWQYTQYEIIDVTDEEMVKIGLSSFGHTGPQPIDQHAPQDALGQIVSELATSSDLTVLMSFFREGKNEFIESRFINSFHNCYYVLEGMYGNGKSKNSAVEQQFLASAEVLKVFEEALGIMRRKHPMLFNQIAEVSAGGDGTFDIRDVVGKVVWLRGHVHHYNPKSSKKQATPLNHHEYEAWATLLLLTSRLCLEAMRSTLAMGSVTFEESL